MKNNLKYKFKFVIQLKKMDLRSLQFIVSKERIIMVYLKFIEDILTFLNLDKLCLLNGQVFILLKFLPKKLLEIKIRNLLIKENHL
jgi:hypothetical protein